MPVWVQKLERRVQEIIVFVTDCSIHLYLMICCWAEGNGQIQGDHRLRVPVLCSLCSQNRFEKISCLAM